MPRFGSTSQLARKRSGCCWRARRRLEVRRDVQHPDADAEQVHLGDERFDRIAQIRELGHVLEHVLSREGEVFLALAIPQLRQVLLVLLGLLARRRGYADEQIDDSAGDGFGACAHGAPWVRAGPRAGSMFRTAGRTVSPFLTARQIVIRIAVTTEPPETRELPTLGTAWTPSGPEGTRGESEDRGTTNGCALPDGVPVGAQRRTGGREGGRGLRDQRGRARTLPGSARRDGAGAGDARARRRGRRSTPRRRARPARGLIQFTTVDASRGVPNAPRTRRVRRSAMPQS